MSGWPVGKADLDPYQPGADAIERCRNVLAHPGRVRAAARELDFTGSRKQPVLLPADPIHHALGEAPLQKLHQ